MRKHLLSLVLSILCVLTVPALPASAARGECFPYVRSAAVAKIVSLESGGDPDADNPKSSAYGCGQLLYSTRKAYAKACGTSVNTSDPASQMCMTHEYIDDRYGSDNAALRFKLSRGYY